MWNFLSKFGLGKAAASVWEPPQKIASLFEATAANQFASINRPTSGARDDNPVPSGEADYQLYSLGTPNGNKAGIVFEELGVEYDAHVIHIGKGEQFSKGFVDINPNSKIPCAVDMTDKAKPVKLFESASIMLYLADKHGRFIPTDTDNRAQCIHWLCWSQVQAFVTGNFGHFMVYAPDSEVAARNYGVSRYGMEVQRLCSVLDNHLSHNKYMCGNEYTIADMACFPWYNMLKERWYDHKSGIKCSEFLDVEQYQHAERWAQALKSRPEVLRGLLVCSIGHPKPWLDPANDKYHHLKGQFSDVS